jgi:two-component system chemotaxis response regulator CheB
MAGYDLVAIGASWGGMRALEVVLGGLPGDFPVPVVVAQHRDPDSEDDLLAMLLRRHLALRVCDAEDGQELRPGLVVLAPPGYHMLVDDAHASLSIDELVQFARPSIDVLFDSASEQYGARTLGVVLTGANADGAGGLATIRRRGGYAIVQDPATAERPEMPRAALAAEPDEVLPLDAIAPRLCELCGAGVRA